MALKTYKLDPANVSTFGATSLASGTSFSIEMSGEETSLAADGAKFIQRVMVDNIGYTVTVNMMDISLAIKVGDCDDLVLKAIERADCSAGTPDSVTFTFSNAIVTSVNRTVNHQGQSEYVVTFRAFDPDGDDSLTIS